MLLNNRRVFWEKLVHWLYDISNNSHDSEDIHQFKMKIDERAWCYKVWKFQLLRLFHRWETIRDASQISSKDLWGTFLFVFEKFSLCRIDSGIKPEKVSKKRVNFLLKIKLLLQYCIKTTEKKQQYVRDMKMKVFIKFREE